MLSMLVLPLLTDDISVSSSSRLLDEDCVHLSDAVLIKEIRMSNDKYHIIDRVRK